MKQKYTLTILVIFSFLIVNTGCKKFEVLIKTLYSEPTVSAVTQTSATISTDILEVGEGLISYGHSYGITSNPDFDGSKTTNTGTNAEIGTFTEQITGLQPGTKYFVRAYAEEDEIRYSIEKSFTTVSGSLLVVTSEITDIDFSSATSGGTVTSDGSSAVTARGVCWSTTQEPTIADDFTSDNNGTGDFVSSITGLINNTSYFVRAYATSGDGTAYGNEQQFKTLAASIPTVSTTAVSNITALAASSGGEVTNENGGAVTERGVCWSKSTMPTLEDANSTDGPGPGVFTSSLTGLTENDTYYVRAYATNSAGTGYGNEINFKTPANYTGQKVLVTGGDYRMGCGTGQVNCGSNEGPEHQVSLNSFNITIYEITNQEYANFLNLYGSNEVIGGDYDGELMLRYSDFGAGTNNWGVVYDGSEWAPAAGYENFPAIYITWYGANEFCKYYGSRLPTEAEWEYAARGGTNYEDYFLYSGDDILNNVAWSSSNSSAVSHEVGTKTANQLGIYDMSGNVWEWCADWGADDYYTSNPINNPQGPATGSERVLRGGSWIDVNPAINCRVAVRDWKTPLSNESYFGFRMVWSEQ